MKFLLQKFRPRKAFQFSCCVQLRQRLPLHGTGYGCMGRGSSSPPYSKVFSTTKPRPGWELSVSGPSGPVWWDVVE